MADRFSIDPVGGTLGGSMQPAGTVILPNMRLGITGNTHMMGQLMETVLMDNLPRLLPFATPLDNLSRLFPFATLLDNLPRLFPFATQALGRLIVFKRRTRSAEETRAARRRRRASRRTAPGSIEGRLLQCLIRISLSAAQAVLRQSRSRGQRCRPHPLSS